MSTLIVVPARLGASRLPRKPLRLLAGAPLVIRVWERLSALHLADRVVIATDSDEVMRAAASVGAEAVLTASHHPSGTDRVAEVAALPRFAGHDVIVNVQGDEPFLSGAAVRGVVALVERGAFALATAAAPATAEALASPNVVKVVTADDGRALYFSRAGIPYQREGADAALRARIARQHLGIYAYTAQALCQWVSLPVHPLEQLERLEQLRPLAAGMVMGVALIDEPPRGGIDTEDDLVRANAQWSDLIAGRVE